MLQVLLAVSGCEDIDQDRAVIEAAGVGRQAYFFTAEGRIEKEVGC
jgi:hypothetical protein